MRKFLPLLAALIALPSFAAAQGAPISGEVTVAFGWVKKADGTKVNIAGKKLPFRATPIRTKNLTATNRELVQNGRELPALENPLKKLLSNVNTGSNPKEAADLIVYQADAGSNYGYVEFNPSSLDDINMISSGLNKPWSTMSFGMNYGSSSFSSFIIRWRCFKTNIDNPAPANDFSGEFADFGVKWTSALAQGSYVVEINVAQASVSTDDSSIYVAQQFREPRPNGQAEDGEGPFEYGVIDTVFNAGFPPTTGSSLDQFWYDWDPAPDGKYENTEIDVFDGNVANHVLTIKVASSGSVVSLTAADARKGIGRFVSGSLLSVLTAGDNNEFKINEDYFVARTSPVGSIEVDFIQTAQTITGIRVNGTAGVTISGCDQWVDIYDFTESKWVQLASQPNIPNGSNTFNESYGGTVPLSHFTGVVNHPFFGPIPVIRARVRFKNTNFNVARNWQMKLDQLQCTVNTP